MTHALQMEILRRPKSATRGWTASAGNLRVKFWCAGGEWTQTSARKN